MKGKTKLLYVHSCIHNSFALQVSHASTSHPGGIAEGGLQQQLKERKGVCCDDYFLCVHCKCIGMKADRRGKKARSEQPGQSFRFQPPPTPGVNDNMDDSATPLDCLFTLLTPVILDNMID